MSTLPRVVQRALDGIRATGDDYATWVWFQASTSAEREAVDHYLVEIQHPLSMEAGTAERRFRRLVDEVRFGIHKETKS